MSNVPALLSAVGKASSSDSKSLFKDACCRCYVTESGWWNALFMKELHVLIRSNTMLLRSTSTVSVIPEVFFENVLEMWNKKFA